MQMVSKSGLGVSGICFVIAQHNNNFTYEKAVIYTEPL
jgi:hypothetical protein